MSLEAPLFTRRLTTGEVLILTQDDGIKNYSIKVVSGTATLLGTKVINGLSSTAITLDALQVFSGSSVKGAIFTLTVGGVGSVVDFAASED